MCCLQSQIDKRRIAPKSPIDAGGTDPQKLDKKSNDWEVGFLFGFFTSAITKNDGMESESGGQRLHLCQKRSENHILGSNLYEKNQNRAHVFTNNQFLFWYACPKHQREVGDENGTGNR